MDTLFPITVEAADIPSISGLAYLRDYIAPEEERRLVSEIDREPWDTAWERRRQFYGVGYGRPGDEQRPFPDWARELAARMHAEGISERPFDQMLVNEYLPGQGIAFHFDHKPFDRTVVSLSLLSPCVMDFRRVVDGRRESLLLERRSLLVLSDEARYTWQHGIARRKKDRWQGITLPRARRLSVTFRLLKQ